MFNATISGARRIDAETFLAPGAEALSASIASDLKAMMGPIEVAEPEIAASLRARLDATLRALPDFKGDRVAHRQVAALASARRGGDDSLHLLVMDLHKALNQIAAATAVEESDGAREHSLDDASRARVRAFVRGLNRTAKLAFGHPGLGTTAGRVGARLTIQNDIGATDAHVIVVHVEGLAVTTTYTDVHRIRAEFFMALFADEAVEWSPLAENKDRDLAKGEVFYLLNGVYQARDEADLDRFLAFLGSRVVFLIDSNKARKALQSFVSKSGAIELLLGAAQREDGHRAFSSSAAPISSSTRCGAWGRDASPTACRSNGRSARVNAPLFCAMSCISRRRVSRTGARRASSATKSRLTCRRASTPPRANCLRPSCAISASPACSLA
jgi:hypothetical protein